MGDRMDDELRWVDAVGHAERIARGALTPLELVDAAIARIERHDPAAERGDRAVVRRGARRRRARRCPTDRYAACRSCSRTSAAQQARPAVLRAATARCMPPGYRSPADTALGARFRAAGLITLGKTNVPELGPQPTTQPLAFGATHNPWQLDHTPGGSSGGSCAAVAAGLVPDRACQRRRRLHPPAGGVVRARRPQAVARTHPAAANAGESATPPSSSWRARCATSPPPSTRCTAPSPATSIAAPPPARRFADEVGADPGPLRIGLLARSPLRRRARRVHARASSRPRATSKRSAITSSPRGRTRSSIADVGRRTAALWAVDTAHSVTRPRAPPRPPGDRRRRRAVHVGNGRVREALQRRRVPLTRCTRSRTTRAASRDGGAAAAICC